MVQSPLAPLIRSFFTLLALAVLGPPASATDTFEIGVVPYLPTPQLLQAYAPLRGQVEQIEGRPTHLSTAADIRAYMERVLRREYDLVVLGPGLGRLAQKDAGYVPLLLGVRRTSAVIVVQRGAPYSQVRELRGRRISTMDPLTLVGQLGADLLRNAGLRPEQDVVLSTARTPYNCALAVGLGEVDAAIVPRSLLDQMPTPVSAGLRALAESRPMPGIMLLVRSGTTAAQADRLRRALVEFSSSEAGRQFVAALHQDGFANADEVLLRAVDPFLPDMRRLFVR